MEKNGNSKNSNINKNLLSTNNKKNQSKNIFLEKPQKSILKKGKIIHNTNKRIDINILEKKKLMKKQKSNDLTLSYNIDNKNKSNQILLSNSCTKRDKVKLKNINTKNNLVSNKTKYFNHKKFYSISNDCENNYKKYLGQIKKNQKNNLSSKIFQSYSKNETNFTKFNEISNRIKVKKTIYRNKNNIDNNKLLNRSMELRNKIKDFKLNEKSKLIKNKGETKNNINNKPKISKIIPKIINNKINDKDFEYFENDKSNEEICQTFSNEENINTYENYENIQKNKNFKLLKINTTYEKSMPNRFIIPKSSISIDRIESKDLINRNIQNKKTCKNNGKKLKHLIREFCIDNSKLNNNKYKNKIINDKKSKISKNYFDDYLTNNKKKLLSETKRDNLIKSNNKIFEIISDIKVKSYNEYEQEKKINENVETGKSNQINQINNNININININYNNFNINNPSINSSNDDKEESCENNNYLKETYSRDRFSFKPVNNEIITDYEYYNNNTIGKKLNKKDFINDNNNKNGNESKKNINSNKEKNKITNNEFNKIKKIKKSKKNNTKSKLNKGTKILNKSDLFKRKK